MEVSEPSESLKDFLRRCQRESGVGWTMVGGLRRVDLEMGEGPEGGRGGEVGSGLILVVRSGFGSEEDVTEDVEEMEVMEVEEDVEEMAAGGKGACVLFCLKSS